MTASELIAKLKYYHPDAEVKIRVIGTSTYLNAAYVTSPLRTKAQDPQVAIVAKER